MNHHSKCFAVGLKICFYYGCIFYQTKFMNGVCKVQYEYKLGKFQISFRISVKVFRNRGTLLTLI